MALVAFSGGGVTRGYIRADIVEYATGIGSKQLVHRNRNPLRLIDFLRDRFKERVLDRVGCSGPRRLFGIALYCTRRQWGPDHWASHKSSPLP